MYPPYKKGLGCILTYIFFKNLFITYFSYVYMLKPFSFWFLNMLIIKQKKNIKKSSNSNANIPFSIIPHLSSKIKIKKPTIQQNSIKTSKLETKPIHKKISTLPPNQNHSTLLRRQLTLSRHKDDIEFTAKFRQFGRICAGPCSRRTSSDILQISRTQGPSQGLPTGGGRVAA